MRDQSPALLHHLNAACMVETSEQVHLVSQTRVRPQVSLGSSNESLTLQTSERYSLNISFPNATLTADTVFGALRGLETFAQMVQPDFSMRQPAGQLCRALVLGRREGGCSPCHFRREGGCSP